MGEIERYLGGCLLSRRAGQAASVSIRNDRVSRGSITVSMPKCSAARSAPSCPLKVSMSSCRRARRQELIETFKGQLGALRAAEHFGIDTVIDPRDTRSFLIETLAACPARRLSKHPPKYRSISPI